VFFGSYFYNFLGCAGNLSAEWISLVVLVFSLCSLLIFFKRLGLTGLYVYNCLSVCLANIQILHLTSYSFFTTPLPLGTVLFTTTFFSTSLITDQYGPQAARQGIFLSFLAYGFFSLSMLLSLKHAPASGNDVFLQNAHDNYRAMCKIFRPSLRLFLASLASFTASQWVDVIGFQWIKRLTKGRFLWLRQGGSMFFSSFIDHFLFSYLAFYFFITPKPTLNLFWNGYVFNSFLLRYGTIFVCVLAASLWKRQRRQD
jgi:uncharacterized integral membrane protein (TIGR00697 family)